MIKCTGREAVSILAEVEAEKRTLTEGEMRYAEKQAESFVLWLSQQPNMDLEKAKEVRERIFTNEVKLLLQTDPYAEFTWSRRDDEVGEAEINLTEMSQDFDSNLDAEHKEYEAFWAGNHLQKHEGKYSPDQWKNSQNKLDQAIELLKKYQERLSQSLTLNAMDMNYLRKVNKRVNELRFGKAPILMHRHWAQAKNILNELLGHSKRYVVKEVPEKNEDEKIDAMDNAVYGYFEGNQLYS
jgi:hypothetical protein